MIAEAAFAAGSHLPRREPISIEHPPYDEWYKSPQLPRRFAIVNQLVETSIG